MISLEQRFALEDLYARYSACLDEARFADWPDFFTEACWYRVVPRENFDRGLPLSTMAAESRGMLKDRVYGIQNTLYHQPYYQRHIVSGLFVRAVTPEGIHTQANYAVFRTKLSGLTTVFNVGRYLDTVLRTPQGLKFASRVCVYDSEMIPNSIIYPI